MISREFTWMIGRLTKKVQGGREDWLRGCRDYGKIVKESEGMMQILAERVQGSW